MLGFYLHLGTTMLARVLLVALLWSIPSQVGAQEADSDRPYGTLMGARLGSPEKFAVGLIWLQAIWVEESAATPRDVVFVGPYGDVGVSGARLGLGLGGCCSGPADLGFQVRAGLLRTWGNPWTVEGGQTFAGGEVRINLFVWFFLSPGYYWMLKGTGPSEAFLFSVGVGL